MRDHKGNEFEFRARMCPTCGDVPQRVLGKRGGRYHRYGYGVETTIVSCEGCSLLFPNPFPYPRDPQRLYGDPEIYFPTAASDGLVESRRELVREAIRRSGLARPRVLDVGAGRGDFLAACRREGLDNTVGLELSHEMIAYAREHMGVTLQPVLIEDFARTKPEPFDVVILNAVLEHVHDPDSFMEAVAALTLPGALVYIDVPHEPHLMSEVGNWLNRLRRNPAVFNLQPTWEPFHVFGFNRRALERLLDKHGLELRSLRIHATPGVPSQGGLDRIKAGVASAINHVANWTGTASNMFVWAQRR